MNLLAHAGWHYGPGPWWPIIPLLFWLTVAAVIFFWVRRRPGGWHRGPSPEDVLAERYARGEVSADEYRERLAVLRERAR